ncbi:MAG: HAMP domain-containing sensor histidine kinase [Deinococcota bacterium]
MLQKHVLANAKSRRITRWAFFVIIFFVLSQVIWWIIFQHNYVRRVTNMTLETWQREANLINMLAEREQTAALSQFPYLQRQSGEVIVDDLAIADFRARQQGYLRMFAFEGPFFVVVILSGLYIIYQNLRAERELKARQQNFLNAISHEFKTPLSSLKLLLETALYRTLDTTLDPAKTRRYLTKMQGELARLETTSEQVLAAARLERPNISGALIPTDLARTVRDIIARLQPGLEARGGQLSLEADSLEATENTPLMVRLDEAALSLVLSNLFDNAIKYTPADNKPITVRLRSAKHHATIEVEDSGIGIRDGDHSRIFDKFYRVGNELTRQSKGIGLGLYLVKTTVEAMNGWVRCEPLRQGTRFAIMLPKYIAEDVTAPSGVEVAGQAAQIPPA